MGAGTERDKRRGGSVQDRGECSEEECAITPIFSFLLLSRPLFEVLTGVKIVSTINYFGVIVLGVAALGRLFMELQYFLMEIAGNPSGVRISRTLWHRISASTRGRTRV
jgi:hypothetical protein